MKLGTETGSLTNHVLSRAVIGQPSPEVGMGATVLLRTDRRAATIIKVGVAGRYTYVTVREDKALRSDSNGMSEDQSYNYFRNPNGHTSIFRSNGGAWQHVVWNEATKRFNKSEGATLRIGERNEYRDFSF
jgi:hypothetical protein